MGQRTEPLEVQEGRHHSTHGLDHLWKSDQTKIGRYPPDLDRSFLTAEPSENSVIGTPRFCLDHESQVERSCMSCVNELRTRQTALSRGPGPNKLHLIQDLPSSTSPMLMYNDLNFENLQ